MSHYYSPDVPYSQAMSRPQLQHFHFITGLPSLYSKECDALLLPGMAWPGLYPGIAPNINPPTKLHRPGHHLPSQTLDTTPTTTHDSNHTLPPLTPPTPSPKKNNQRELVINTFTIVSSDRAGKCTGGSALAVS